MFNLNQHEISDDELGSVNGGQQINGYNLPNRMVYCPYCKKPVYYREASGNRKFCSVCGNPL